MKWLGGVLAASLTALAALGCRTPTQITFDVTTNVPCASTQGTTIVAGPLAVLTDDRPPTTSAPRCVTEGHIGSLVVVPSGDDDEVVAVKVVTGVSVPPDQCGPNGEGCIVAKRALHYLAHESLTVIVPMDVACEGVQCGSEETCVEGACVSAVIGDPAACEGSGCGSSVLAPADGGATIADAGGKDATLPSDGSGIDASGGDSGGDGSLDASSASDGSHLTPTWIGISENFACALLPDHTVACWGHDDVGELGNGTEDDASFVPTPMRVPGLDHVARLAVGEAHACVVFDDGGVSCWGMGGYGATGTVDTTDHLVPEHVPGLEASGLIAAGEYETCVASVDGRRIKCWGYAFGEYDNNTDTPESVDPVDAAIVEMAAGRAVGCGRFDDGTVRCWGQNGTDALGQGAALQMDAESTAPLVVAGLPTPMQICTAWTQSCVLDSSNRVWCWGANDEGQLGPVDAGDHSSTPLLVGIDPHVLKVVCGAAQACILYDDGGTLCWGDDSLGELGVASSPGPGITTSIPNLGPARDIFAGGLGECAILVDGGVACWGNDVNQQLGAGGSSLGPTPIGAFPVVF